MFGKDCQDSHMYNLFFGATDHEIASLTRCYAFFLLQIRPEDHREPPSEVETLCLAKHTVKLELGKGKIVECNVLSN